MLIKQNRPVVSRTSAAKGKTLSIEPLDFYGSDEIRPFFERAFQFCEDLRIRNASFFIFIEVGAPKLLVPYFGMNT